MVSKPAAAEIKEVTLGVPRSRDRLRRCDKHLFITV